MEIKRKKEAKRKTNGSPAASVELPNPSSSRTRPTEAMSTNSTTSSVAKEPAPVEVSLPAPVKPSSAAQDLLGLGILIELFSLNSSDSYLLLIDTSVSSSASNDLFGGLLTSAPSANGSAIGGQVKNADEDSFFNQKAPSTTEKRTLDKNSILALYNQGGTNASTAAVPSMQNMFAAQGLFLIAVNLFSFPEFPTFS